MDPGPVFQYFTPIEFPGTVNKKQTGKRWEFIFICTAISAIHVELSESHSTDSFLMPLRRFMCMRGTPFKIQSDRCEKLVAASKQLEAWDFSRVLEWPVKKWIE